MIVVDVGLKDAAQMPLVQEDDMIEGVSPDTSDEPLAVGILPGTVGGDLDFFDAPILDSLLKMVTVD